MFELFLFAFSANKKASSESPQGAQKNQTRYNKSTSGSTVTYAYTSGTNKQDDGFDYDLVGNIVNIFIRVTDCGIGGTPDQLDRTFEYDPIYRLTYADGRESDTQSGNTYLYDDAPAPSTPLPSNVNYYERNYDYDKLGNVLSVVQTGTNGFTRDYTYNANSNTLNKIEDATPATIEDYTYDSCGNTATTNLNRNYVWNHADQLLCYYNQVGSADPTVFTQYDYAGQNRVSKLVRTGTAMSPVYERTIYIDGIFEYMMLDNGSTYKKSYVRVMDDKSQVAEIRVGDVFPGDISDDVVYILEDQIGSSVVRLSDMGTVIDEEEYYPFGDSSLRTFTYKRYRYVGKERDAESGLYYYGARYYAAWTCRFISVDPLAKKYAHLSPYNYADNNPINDFDIDGLQNNNSSSTPQHGTMSAATGATTPVSNNIKTQGSITSPPKTEPKQQAKAPKSLDQMASESRPEEAKLYDANSIDGPGAWRLSEGAYVGQQAKRDIQSTDNVGMKTSIFLYHFLAPVTMAAAGGAVGAKGTQILRTPYRSAPDNVTNPQAPAGRTGPAQEKAPATPVNDGKSGNFDITKIEPLKNTLPISSEGSLLGTIKDGKISMKDNSQMTGKFDFVVMKTGEVLLGSKHTFLSGGADVLAAGELKLRNGEIVGMNNLSGHYQANPATAGNYLNIFKGLGINVSKAQLQIYNSQGRLVNHIKQ